MQWLHSAVALILAVGVSVSLILLAANEFTHNGHLTTDETTVIATVLGAGIGTLATYIGTRTEDSPLTEEAERRLVNRFPAESHLKRPPTQLYDQDATAEVPTIDAEPPQSPS